MERRISTVILNVYQSTGIEKEDGSRQSLENHGKLEEIRRFYNKKFEEGHDVYRNLALAGDYSKTKKWGGIPVRIWSNGDSIQPFLGFRGRECPQEF